MRDAFLVESVRAHPEREPCFDLSERRAAVAAVALGIKNTTSNR